MKIVRNSGFIRSRSREDPSFENSFPLIVPVENAERFSVEEVILGEQDLLMFYSYYSKEEDACALAVSTLDVVSGKARDVQKLFSEPGKRELSAGKLYIQHHMTTGVTTVLVIRLGVTITGAVNEFIQAKFDVILLDREGKVSHQGTGMLTKNDRNKIDKVHLVANGDIYFKTYNGIKFYDHDRRSVQTLKVPKRSKDEQNSEYVNVYPYDYFTEDQAGKV